jgi:hypothetical protein
MKLLMLQEAYRLVEIKEGGQKIRLPLIQLMIRKMGILAAQGNSRARRDYMDLLSLIEEEKSASYQVYQKKLFDYKMDVGEEYERRKKLNPSEPAPLPHPDDIIVNPATGSIRLCGPSSKEEEIWWNRIEASEAEIAELQSLLADDPTNEYIKKDIAHERKVRKQLALVIPHYRPRPSRRKQRDAERTRAFLRKLAELDRAGEPAQTDGSTSPSPKPRIEASEAAITELQALLAEDPTNELIRKDLAHQRKVRKLLARIFRNYKSRPSRRKQRDAERARELAELDCAGEPPRTEGSAPQRPKPTWPWRRK